MSISFYSKYILFISILFTFSVNGQSNLDSLSFFEPAPSFHKKRFNKALGFSVGTYTAFSVGLYNIWYAKFEQEPFHFFDDYGEWENIDKLGHLYTSYFQGILCYKGAKWTGLTESQAILTGILCGTLFQSTIEIMDGFSSGWGFSLTDMAANTIGLSAFALQQKIWHEQRIMFKVSSWPKNRENIIINSTDGSRQTDLFTRTNDLFGENYSESFLKDYNAQTIWASVNVHAFLRTGNKWPAWLNLAVGYSADNMFGGFDNIWEIDGKNYQLDPAYDRYKQFILAFDLDMTRIKTKNHFLKTLFSVFNIFKIPSPAIELNSKGEISFHFIYLN